VARAEVEADAADDSSASRHSLVPADPDDIDVVARRPEVRGHIAVPDTGSASTARPWRGRRLERLDELEVDRADVRDDADLRRAILHSSAIWPKPRIASSRMQTSVSGSSRQSVSGTPISLLKLASAAIVRATGAQSAARMSFVDVLPIEPVMPTMRAALRSRTARPIWQAAKASSGTSVAAAPRDECVSRYVRAAANGDEEVAVDDPARVDLHAGEASGPRIGPRRVPRGSRVSSAITPVPSACAAPSRATSAVVEGHLAARDLLPVLVTLAGDHDDVARVVRLDRAARSRVAVELDLEVEPAGDLSSDFRGSSLRGLSGRDQHDVARAPSTTLPINGVSPIAVAAGAEHADDPAASELACASQHGLERSRRVCIVDEDRERLALVDRVEAAGTRSTASIPCLIGFRRKPNGPRRRGGGSAFVATLNRPPSLRLTSPRLPADQTIVPSAPRPQCARRSV
jgi:hypothetical protein